MIDKIVLKYKKGFDFQINKKSRLILIKKNIIKILIIN